MSWSSVHNDDAKSGLEAVCAAVPCLSPGRQALSLTSEKARPGAVSHTQDSRSHVTGRWQVEVFLQQPHLLGRNPDHFPQYGAQ